MRVCTKCQKELPDSAFHRRENGRLRNECAACVYQKVKRWRKENPEKYRAMQKRRKRVYRPKPPREIVCAWCGQTVTATGGRQKFCSRACHLLQQNHGDKPERRCEVCGKPLARLKRADAVTCSPVCNVRLWQSRNEERHRRNAADNASRRRARKRDLPEEPIDRLSIYDRDKGICHLCGRKVSPKTFHLDHLVPVSLGGGTVAANLRVAHPSCNVRKHTKAMNEQLMLIG